MELNEITGNVYDIQLITSRQSCFPLWGRGGADSLEQESGKGHQNCHQFCFLEEYYQYLSSSFTCFNASSQDTTFGRFFLINCGEKNLEYVTYISGSACICLSVQRDAQVGGWVGGCFQHVARFVLWSMTCCTEMRPGYMQECKCPSLNCFASFRVASRSLWCKWRCVRGYASVHA